MHIQGYSTMVGNSDLLIPFTTSCNALRTTSSSTEDGKLNGSKENVGRDARSATSACRRASSSESGTDATTGGVNVKVGVVNVVAEDKMGGGGGIDVGGRNAL